jgi:transposase-like protein
LESLPKETNKDHRRKGRNKKYTCKECDSTFTTKGNLNGIAYHLRVE